MIREKDLLKERVTMALQLIVAAKQQLATHHAFMPVGIGDFRELEFREKLAYARGFLRATELARSELRAIAHGPRIDAADNDRQAQAFIETAFAPAPLSEGLFWGDEQWVPLSLMEIRGLMATSRTAAKAILPPPLCGLCGEQHYGAVDLPNTEVEE
jgi:hypothetical protein